MVLGIGIHTVCDNHLLIVCIVIMLAGNGLHLRKGCGALVTLIHFMFEILANILLHRCNNVSLKIRLCHST